MRSMLLAVLLFATAATAQPPSAGCAAAAQIVSAGQRRADEGTVEKLVSFGTRHTLSSQTDPKRGHRRGARTGPKASSRSWAFRRCGRATP